MPIDWAALQANFALADLEFRVQQAGEKSGRTWALCVPYVTNRAIMQRLDDVAGPENWRNEFAAGPGGGVLCGISIRVNGEWVTKWDGAENTDIESVKGGLSGSMKRAAVQWGIGRVLYRLDEMFANVHEGGKERGKTRAGKLFRWDPPTDFPAWALPQPRLTPEEREHAAMLVWLKTRAEAMAETVSVPIGGKPASLKVYMRKNWKEAERNPAMAATFCALVKEATGEEFKHSPAAV